MLQICRLVLVQDNLKKRLRLRRRQRLGVRKQRLLPGRGAGIGDGRDLLLLEVVGDTVARHLVGRVPARADGDVQRPGIEHRMRVVPADGSA